MIRDYFESRRHTIPAGLNTLRLPISGTLFRLLDCSQLVTVKLVRDGGHEVFDMAPGQGREYSDGKGFQLVEVSRHADYPDNSAPLVVQIGHGTGAFLDTRAVPALNRLVDWRGMRDIHAGTMLAAEYPAKLVGVPLTSDQVAGLGTVSLTGAAPDGFTARKAVIISNDDPGNKLTVYDAAGTKCLRVYPMTSVRLDTSEAVIVKNDNAAPVAATISELWYLA